MDDFLVGLGDPHHALRVLIRLALAVLLGGLVGRLHESVKFPIVPSYPSTEIS